MSALRRAGLPRLSVLTDEAVQAKRARYLLAAALAGLVLYLILDAIAQVLPPYYSPISQAESDLAVGPYGYIMALNFINRGVLSLCFLFGMVLTVYSSETASRRFRRGAYAFAFWSVGALLLAAFPTDVPAAPISWHGAIHFGVAIIAFLGGAIGALYISLGMAENRSISRARGVALPFAIVALLLCVVELLSGFAAHGIASNYGGLIERLFLGSVLLWIGLVSAKMLISRPSQMPLQPQAESFKQT